MKYSEFQRWLASRGVTFKKARGGGSHFKVKAPNGNQTTFPNHGAKEIGEGLRKEIIKQLGLKE
jgi:mRNA interferase HicA